jgi:hypothetical protein
LSVCSGSSKGDGKDSKPGAVANDKKDEEVYVCAVCV